MSSDASGSTRTIEWLAWFEVNKMKLLVAVIAIAAVVAAFALYRAKVIASEQAGWSALFKVARPGSRGDQAESASPQAYLDVAAAHPGTAAGAQARLLAARALFEQGKFPEARAQFEGFARLFGESEFVGAAELGVAASLDSENKAGEALAAYQAVVAQRPNTAEATQAKLAIARIHESRNDFTQALKLYDELARPTSQTVWGAEASMRRDYLLQAHPELAATNPPAPISATATNVVRILSTNPPSAKP